MSATVPESRVDLRQGEVAISNSVRSVHWVEAARQQCWLAGRGSIDVPVHCPLVTVSAADSANFRYWTKPRYQTTRYAYSLVLTASSSGTCTVTIGGTPHAVRVDRPRDATPVTIFVDRASQSESEAELGFTLAAPSGFAVTLHSVGIEAVPRYLLATSGSDLGTDRLGFWPRQPIFELRHTDEILDRQNELRSACRRVGEYQLSLGDKSPFAITTASPSWAALLDDEFTLLGRYLFSTDTTRTMSWRILAKCSDGTTAGSCRVNNTSGGSGVSTITIPAGTTSYTWLPVTSGAAATFACDAENNTVSNGRRSSRDDEHMIEANRSAGAGTINIASISIYDAAA